jgi:hypothetical protein
LTGLLDIELSVRPSEKETATDDVADGARRFVCFDGL